MPSTKRQLESDFRRDNRFDTSFCVTAEHRVLGKLTLKVVNLSLTGLLIDGRSGIGRGDKIMMVLPGAREVEALCLWTCHQEAGLHFDHAMNFVELMTVIKSINRY